MNKKNLYENIISSISKEVKKVLNEYRTAKVFEEHDISEDDVLKWLKIPIIKWLQEKIQNNAKMSHGWGSAWSSDIQLQL